MHLQESSLFQFLGIFLFFYFPISLSRLQRSSMCLLNFHSWSIAIPSKINSFLEGMLMSLTFMLKDLFLFPSSTINWNLSGLALRELNLNNSSTLFDSSYRLLKTWSRSLLLQSNDFCHDWSSLKSACCVLWALRKLQRTSHWGNCWNILTTDCM